MDMVNMKLQGSFMRVGFVTNVTFKNSVIIVVVMTCIYMVLKVTSLLKLFITIWTLKLSHLLMYYANMWYQVVLFHERFGTNIAYDCFDNFL